MRASTILAAALATAPLAAAAAGGAVTVYGGYRAGGGFTDAVTNESIDTRSAGTVAASVDFPVDASRQVQLLVSHQNSTLEVRALPGSPLAALDGRSMSVTHLHLGGTASSPARSGSAPTSWAASAPRASSRACAGTLSNARRRSTATSATRRRAASNWRCVSRPAPT